MKNTGHGRRSRAMRALGILTLLLATLGAAKCHQQSVVDELLTAFEGGCSAGAWTSAALDRSQRLTKVYKSLTAKASCQNNQNLDDAILGTSQFQQALSNAIEHENYYRGERVAEENANDLYFALSDPNLDSQLRSQLLSYYASQRYELSYNRTVLNYLDNTSYRSRAASGLDRFGNLSRGILANTNELASCLADNPAKMIDIAANVGLVAGSFAPPMVGLGVAAVSQLLKVGVEAATAFPSAEAVYETRRDRMPAAMTCGLEALTRDYCKAKDAYTLVNLTRGVGAGLGRRKEPLPFFYGIELADRDLPILYQWLDQVVGGSSSANLEQSKKVNDQFSRLNRMLQMKRNTQGIFADLERYLRNSKGSSTDRLDKVKQALGDVMLKALYSEERGLNYPWPYSDGPFTNDSPFVLAYRLAGFEGQAPPYANIDNIRVYIGEFPFTYTDELAGKIRSRTEALLNERHQRVLAEFIQNVNLNPSIVIRDASSETAGGLSAVRALERLEGFFEIFAYGPSPHREQDEELIRQVRDSLKSIRQDLMSADATRTGRAEEIIANVFNLFKLENTNVFLPTHLQSLIRNDLTTRYRRGEGPKSVEDILLTAGRDMDSMLTRTKLGAAEVRGDLELAQSKTLGTIHQFRGFFAGSIGQAIKDLKDAAERGLEPPATPGSHSPNRHTLARLCILTLISDTQWPDEVDKALCAGSRMYSPDAGLEISFDELDAKFSGPAPVPLDDRLCLHQEFLRLDRLAGQNLGTPGTDEGERETGILAAPESASGAGAQNRSFWQQVLESRLRESQPRP